MNSYTDDIVSFCKSRKISYVIPGGEEPLKLLVEEFSKLLENNIVLVNNDVEFVKTYSNKKITFDKLKELGIDIPYTKEVSLDTDFRDLPYPCVIKPFIGTGGSDGVYIVGNPEDCELHCHFLIKSGKKIIIQEYIPLDEGEFTIGVLSLTDATVVGAIVMKRIFNSKLSISFKNKYGIISSGYSQGLIDYFPDIQEQAVAIASAVKSRGPINIQCRLRNGKIIPFEINPRFSASTYLRALAGFNEIDIFLRHLINGENKFKYDIKTGYYLRSFTESYVRKIDKKQ
ncbi:MAG: ATP-grasp domain-containing protein [Candidatus Calescibacterium sp.]|nr:ATP-grasp domain-containing protein [Candidatus Calescibacterium sp.]